MDTITLSTAVAYGNESLTGSVTLPASDVLQGVMEANTSYAELKVFNTPPQAVVIANGGAVDVSVRLKFDTTKYAFFTVPADRSIVVPGFLNVNNLTTLQGVEAIDIKTASSTADVTYVIVY